MPADSARVLELRATLLHIEPAIWRLLRVPHDIRMDRLHDVLQVAFGWTNSHLHQFHLFDAKGRVTGYVGTQDPEFDDRFTRGPATRDETTLVLHELLARPGDRIGYEYDFGDGWIHLLELTAVHPQTSRLTRALCLDGALAGPPEDCGGPPGYQRLREIMGQPKHPEYRDLKQWLGPHNFSAFDPAATTRVLGKVKL